MVPAIFISIQMTGNPIPQLGMGGEINDGSGKVFTWKIKWFVERIRFSEYTKGNKSVIDVFCITLALMVGTAGDCLMLWLGFHSKKKSIENQWD